MDIKSVAYNQTLKTAGPASAQDLEAVAKANKVAQEFESIFLGMMLKSMRTSVPEGGLLESSHGGKIFEEMLDGEYAKMMSKQGISDLAKSLSKEMLKTMENQEGMSQKIKGLQSYGAEQQGQTMLKSF